MNTGYIWTQIPNPVRPKTQVIWNCDRCGLMAFFPTDTTHDSVDAECISQGPKYASCNNYLIQELLES